MPRPATGRPLEELPEPVRQRVVDEAVDETTARLRAGTPTYPAVALLFFVASWYLPQEVGWATPLVISTLAASALRLITLRVAPRIWKRTRRVGRWVVGLGVSAPLLCFSVIAAQAIALEGPTVPSMLLLLCAGIFPVALTVVLSPSLVLGRTLNTLVLVPVAAAGAVSGGAVGWLLAAVIAALYLYLLALGKGYYTGYWRAAVDRALREVGEADRRLLATAVEHADQVVILTDAEGRIEYANPVALRMTDARDDVRGRHPFDLGAPDSAEDSRELRDRLERHLPWAGRVKLRQPDGALIDMVASVSPVRAETGDLTHWVWMGRDVTEEVDREQRMAAANRMASLGTLAAGVAHEINNPLAYVSLHVEHLRAATQAGTELRTLVDEIGDGTERVRHTVQQLLAFSRNPDPSEDGKGSAAADLAEVIDAARRLTDNEVRHRASLEVDHQATRPAAAAERELTQVVINLVVNAAEAIDETANDDDRISVRTRDHGERHVVIEVSDTGPGIARDHIARVFDPFFTTKTGARGTGLGLANCRHIVTGAGGHIEAMNRSEGGATFRIVLPAAEALQQPISEPDPALAASGERTSHGVPARRARVLVVDDEPIIGRALRRLLREHEVSVAENGQEAVRLWRRGGFDVMLCDVMMPGFTGEDVYCALRDDGRGHERRMVFMTGGAFTPATQRFLEAIPNEKLGKPIDTRRLRQAIAEIAERAPSPRGGSASDEIRTASA